MFSVSELDVINDVKNGCCCRLVKLVVLLQTCLRQLLDSRLVMTAFFFFLCVSLNQSRVILTTQAWKQTLPPSDRTLYYTSAGV